MAVFIPWNVVQGHAPVQRCALQANTARTAWQPRALPHAWPGQHMQRATAQTIHIGHLAAVHGTFMCSSCAAFPRPALHAYACCRRSTKVAPAVILYNYGSPRVGNEAFAEEFNKLVPNAWRFVNAADGEDVVTRIPPLMGEAQLTLRA